MNYLAHLYLAEDSAESILGNFLGDFVKGSTFKDYSEGIQKGIQQHRKIDVFTDAHPVFLETKQWINPKNRRYAGIVIDIFYDHFLASQWSNYSKISLNQFSKQFYKLLEDNEKILPERLQKVVPKITSENWLMSYLNISGIDQSLKKLSLRVKRENYLETAVDDLVKHYPIIENSFINFFPDLIKFNQTLK